MHTKNKYILKLHIQICCCCCCCYDCGAFLSLFHSVFPGTSIIKQINITVILMLRCRCCCCVFRLLSGHFRGRGGGGRRHQDYLHRPLSQRARRRHRRRLQQDKALPTPLPRGPPAARPVPRAEGSRGREREPGEVSKWRRLFDHHWKIRQAKILTLILIRTRTTLYPCLPLQSYRLIAPEKMVVVVSQRGQYTFFNPPQGLWLWLSLLCFARLFYNAPFDFYQPKPSLANQSAFFNGIHSSMILCTVLRENRMHAFMQK